MIKVSQRRQSFGNHPLGTGPGERCDESDTAGIMFARWVIKTLRER